MTLSSDLKAVLQADTALMALLTGGVFIDVEEISLQKTAAAFDSNKEIKPCALIKIPNEVPTGPYLTSVRSAFVIYVYQRSGYDVISAAIVKIFADLNEQRIGTNVWNIEFVSTVHQQRDQALDCPLGSLRFSAVRKL
jgi:hypothetical protein